MPQPSLKLPNETIDEVESNIAQVIEIGSQIRSLLGGHGKGETWDEKWEVQAAVEALDVMASRWTIEIMSALYIAGPKRFNQLKHLLKGISISSSEWRSFRPTPTDGQILTRDCFLPTV